MPIISYKQNKVVLLLPRVACEGTQSYCEGTQTLRSLANEKNNFTCHLSTTVDRHEEHKDVKIDFSAPGNQHSQTFMYVFMYILANF